MSKKKPLMPMSWIIIGAIGALLVYWIISSFMIHNLESDLVTKEKALTMGKQYYAEQQKKFPDATYGSPTCLYNAEINSYLCSNVRIMQYPGGLESKTEIIDVLSQRPITQVAMMNGESYFIGCTDYIDCQKIRKDLGF